MAQTQTKLRHGDPMPFSEDSTDTNCALCGRPVGEFPAYWAEVADGGRVWDRTIAGEPKMDGGYMGWWPVGSECRKRFTPSAVTKNVDAI